MLLLLKRRISSLRNAKLFCRFKCDVIFLYEKIVKHSFANPSIYNHRHSCIQFWNLMLEDNVGTKITGSQQSRFQLLNSLFIVWPGNIGGTMIGSLIDNVWQVTFMQLWVCPRVLMLQKCSLAPRKSYVVFGLIIYKCCF